MMAPEHRTLELVLSIKGMMSGACLSLCILQRALLVFHLLAQRRRTLLSGIELLLSGCKGHLPRLQGRRSLADVLQGRMATLSEVSTLLCQNSKNPHLVA